MAAGWTLAARVRNALMLVRGRPTDQLPRHGVELAGVVQLLGGGDPGEFVDTLPAHHPALPGGDGTGPRCLTRAALRLAPTAVAVPASCHRTAPC